MAKRKKSIRSKKQKNKSNRQGLKKGKGRRKIRSERENVSDQWNLYKLILISI